MGEERGEKGEYADLFLYPARDKGEQEGKESNDDLTEHGALMMSLSSVVLFV